MKKFIINRVSAGATFLDVQFPGWHQRINVGRLDLSDDVDCIVGQLFGHFHDGREKLGLRDNTPEFPDINRHSTLRVFALDVPTLILVSVYIQLAVRLGLRRSDPISYGFFIEAWGPFSFVRNSRAYKRAWVAEIAKRRKMDARAERLRQEREWARRNTTVDEAIARIFDEHDKYDEFTRL